MVLLQEFRVRVHSLLLPSVVLKGSETDMSDSRLKASVCNCFAKAVYSLAKIRTANCPSVRSSFCVLSDMFLLYPNYL